MSRRLAFFLMCCVLSGCAGQATQSNSGSKRNSFEPTVHVLENGESSHITVQHILIGFAGTIPGKGITRSKEEALKLANEVLEKAKAGEDFDGLVKEYTNDAAPGIYRMANFGEASYMRGNPADYVYSRQGMVPAFGDVGFPLQVGEIGMSQFDPEKSPYGWHIVKRLK